MCRAPEIFLDKWPWIIDSAAVSESARKRIPSAKPWRRLTLMLSMRARGYSLTEYRRWIRPRVTSRYEAIAPIVIAVLPRGLAAALLSFRKLTIAGFKYTCDLMERAWGVFPDGRRVPDDGSVK
jgi:hypothetical protein